VGSPSPIPAKPTQAYERCSGQPRRMAQTIGRIGHRMFCEPPSRPGLSSDAGFAIASGRRASIYRQAHTGSALASQPTRHMIPTRPGSRSRCPGGKVASSPLRGFRGSLARLRWLSRAVEATEIGITRIAPKSGCRFHARAVRQVALSTSRRQFIVNVRPRAWQPLAGRDGWRYIQCRVHATLR